MPSLRIITVIQKIWYKVNIMTLMNCNNWKFPIKWSLSFSYINSCSLNKNFEDLQNLLQSTNIQFDVIATTETQITKNISVTYDIELSNYPFEHTPTESYAGSILLRVANPFSGFDKWHPLHTYVHLLSMAYAWFWTWLHWHICWSFLYSFSKFSKFF